MSSEASDLSVSDVDSLTSKRICASCIGEPFLKALVESGGAEAQCDYCPTPGRAITVGELAEHVGGAFDRHYVRTDTDPTSLEQTMLSDREGSYEWVRRGEPVLEAIAGAAGIPEDAAEDVQKILSDGNFSDPSDYHEEEEFDDESHYEERIIDDSRWQREWRKFERSLKTESRYFSQSGFDHLKSVFGGMHKLRTANNGPLVVDAGPGTEFQAFYRARYFEAQEKLEAALAQPGEKIGPPPTQLARQGRMNARGISVFYGAGDADTALAEVSPPVGSRAVVAKFIVLRPLRLLDLRSFREVHETGSIFDPTFAARLERAVFLASLVRKITVPVMPSEEDMEYLPTQAVADFLASSNDPAIDGILYPSVQRGGLSLNVVLFHKAARVAKIELPKGSEVSVSSGHWEDTGFEIDYSVVEKVPDGRDKEDDGGWGAFIAMLPDDRTREDGRTDALAVDVDDIHVHDINRVQVVTTKEFVRRVRITMLKKRKPGDEEALDL